MGKISNYASALKAKLTDYFVIASDNNGDLETKKVTTEQIGDAIASDQVHSSLTTSDKTLIGATNEVNDRKLAMSSSVNRGTIQISGSNNRMVITIYADTNNGMRMDFRGDNNVIRLATTSDGGTNWTNTNEIPFTHI